jgi:23S rRNA A2030 N6-methylase RlmJ
MMKGRLMANGTTELISRAMTAVLGAAGGVLLTYITAVSGHDKAIARLETKLEAVSEQIKEGMNDRYYGSDAVQDFKRVNDRIDKVEAHDERVEQELNRHLRTHGK